MAIRDLLWACPICDAFGSLRAGTRRTDVCGNCGCRFRRSDGASIRADYPDGRSETASAFQWQERLPAIESRFPPEGHEVLGPEPVSVKHLAGFRPVLDHGNLLGWAERMGSRQSATVRLTPDSLVLAYQDSEEVTSLAEVRSIQPTSRSLQIGRRGRPLIALKFSSASIRLWEAVLQARVRNAYRIAGWGEITEFQPVIRAGHAGRRSGRENVRMPLIQNQIPQSNHARQVERTNAVYRICRRTMRTVWKIFGRFDIRGFANIPATGPFLLVCNHQSDLDPPLIQSIIPRPIYAVAKSGLFTAPVLGWLMRRLHSIPVRRYQVDPQSVRTALRRLRAGNGVAIYIEGERSWDGRLQDYRPGTIRLALKANVPIIPVAISGTYEASPRWDTRIRPGTVVIQFLEPIHFAQFNRRADREAALRDAAAVIMSRLEIALANAARGSAASPILQK